MMRSKQMTRKLEFMSEKEKKERLELDAMIERWIVIKEYKFWVLCHNEFPHSDRMWNMVLRSTNDKLLNIDERCDYMKELFSIKSDYVNKWFNFLQNWKSSQSVQFKEHYHIYK